MANPIATDRLKGEFITILDDPENKRIILSGIFGIGKTTFIREFFNSHETEFVAIKLFPVNYSVATNEDIFELIKYDIFYEILQKNPKYDQVDVRWYEALHFMTFEDVKEAVGDFVSLIPKFGKSIKFIGEALVKTVKVFEKKKDKLEKNDLSEIMKYAKKFENNIGGIYENDFYTQLIESLIDSLKKDDKGNISKRIVLVIDDLDRIDPEHIFRILNVFAAHFDRDVTKNKFNIDKIILCCDIENIGRIFKNKYGVGADFNGYIDKFFSKGIFNFQNKGNITYAIPSILSTIKSKTSNSLFLESDHYERKFLLDLLRSFVYSNHLNLRMLSKFLNSYYEPFPRKVYTASTKLDFTINNFRIMILFEFLIDLMGSFESVHQALADFSLKFDLTNSHEDRLIFGDLLYLRGWNGKIMDRHSDKEQRSYMIKGKRINISVYYETVTGINLFGGAYYLDKGEEPLTDPAVMREVLIDAFESYRRITT